MSNPVGRARMKVAKAVTLSKEGEATEARVELREAMQFLDVVIEEEGLK